MLERNVGMELKLDTDEFGNEFSDDIIISFKNKKAQSLLKTIIVEPREEEFYRYKKK